MQFLEFILASVLLTLMPGPDILFVITQSVTQGKKSGIIFALGLVTGLLFHISAAAFGISLIIYQSEVAFNVVKYAGAAYLIYLGILAIKDRKKDAFSLDFTNKKTVKKLYSKGILMNILNPKVSLFFLAFLPQFIDPKASEPHWQILILGGIFILQAILIFSGVAYLSDRLSFKLMQNKRVSLTVHWAKAVLFIGIGIQLILG